MSSIKKVRLFLEDQAVEKLKSLMIEDLTMSDIVNDIVKKYKVTTKKK